MKNQSNSVSRRKFLDSITTAALAVPFLANSTVNFATPNAKLRHACIGVGGMGWHDLQNFKEHPDVEIVALCDVDATNLQRAAEALPNARTYTDWRQLLKKERNKIDSVNVTVPDHNHFAIAYMAIQEGKHVYCQNQCAMMWQKYVNLRKKRSKLGSSHNWVRSMPREKVIVRRCKY